MAKKLWLVEVEVKVAMPIAAETAEEAAQIARQEWMEDIRLNCSDNDAIVYPARLVKTKEELLAGWRGCTPWGGEEDTICEQYIQAATTEQRT